MHIKVRGVVIGFFRFLFALVIAVIATAPVEIGYKPAFDGCGFAPPPVSWCYPGYQITTGFIFGFVLFLLSPKVKPAYIACVFFIFSFGSLEAHQLNLLGPTTLSGFLGALFTFACCTVFKKKYDKNTEIKRTGAFILNISLVALLIGYVFEQEYDQDKKYTLTAMALVVAPILLTLQENLRL